MSSPSQPVMTGDNDYIIENANSLSEACEMHLASLHADLAHVVEQTSFGGAVYGVAGTACMQTAEAIVQNDEKVLSRISDRAQAQAQFAENSQGQEEEAEAAIQAVADAIAAQ